MNGQFHIEGVYVGGGRAIDWGHGAVVSEPRDEITVTLEGVHGDRHLGFTKPAGVREKQFHTKGTPLWNARSWSAVSAEELAEIADAMDVARIEAEWLGANLLFHGCAHLTSLPPLTRLLFPGGAALLVYGENLPCRGPARIIEQRAAPLSTKVPKTFGKAAAKKRGLVGWVERAGVIRPGDTAEIYPP